MRSDSKQSDAPPVSEKGIPRGGFRYFYTSDAPRQHNNMAETRLAFSAEDIEEEGNPSSTGCDTTPKLLKGKQK